MVLLLAPGRGMALKVVTGGEVIVFPGSWLKPQVLDWRVLAVVLVVLEMRVDPSVWTRLLQKVGELQSVYLLFIDKV